MLWTFTSFIHDNRRPYLYFMQNLTVMNIKTKECQYEAVTIPDPYQGLSMHFIILPWPVLPPWGLAYVIANSDHKQENTMINHLGIMISNPLKKRLRVSPFLLLMSPCINSLLVLAIHLSKLQGPKPHCQHCLHEQSVHFINMRTSELYTLQQYC
jgi:hypothetical protein